MLPIFLTGEPRREYEFVWSLQLTAAAMRDPKYLKKMGWVTQAVLTYISQLAKQYTPPDETLNVEEFSIGNITVPVPTGFTINKIKVTYLDDTINTVYNFHKFWQASLYTGSGNIRSFTLNSLYNNCLSATYIDTVKRPLVGDIPTSGVYFPRIFPQTIRRSVMDKSATDLSTVEVTYIRIPLIEQLVSYNPHATSLGTSKPEQVAKDAQNPENY